MSKRISEVSADSVGAPGKRASLLTQQANRTAPTPHSPSETVIPAPVSGQEFEGAAENASQRSPPATTQCAVSIPSLPIPCRGGDVQPEKESHHSIERLQGAAETLALPPMLLQFPDAFLGGSIGAP